MLRCLMATVWVTPWIGYTPTNRFGKVTSSAR